MFCPHSLSATGSSRLVDHLVSCSACPQSVRDGFRALRAEGEGKRKEKRTTEIIAAEERAMAKTEHEEAQARLKQQSIKSGLKNAETHAAYLAIANFF